MADETRTTLQLPVKTTLANNVTDRILFIHNAANTTAANTASMAANTFLKNMLVGPPRTALVAGAVAGNVTVADIRLGDRLDEVVEYVFTTGNVTDVVLLTSEFSITANGVINNTSGTNTTGNKLLVRWTKLT